MSATITDVIHTQSWLAMAMAQLYDRYPGIQWEARPTDHSVIEDDDSVKM